MSAIREVLAWQLEQVMKKRKLSNAGFAKLLCTSRTEANRLLDPESDAKLSSLARAVGRSCHE